MQKSIAWIGISKEGIEIIQEIRLWRKKRKLLNEAKNALKRGDYKKALAYVKKFEELDLRNKRILQMHFDALFKLERYKEAVVLATALTNLAPTNPLNWTQLGEVLEILRVKKLAKKCYSKAVKIYKNYVYAWQCLGDISIELKDFEEAINAIKELIRLQPKNAANWRELATVLISLNNLDDALLAIDKSLSIDSKSIESLETKARILRGLGRLGEASLYENKIRGMQEKDEEKEDHTLKAEDENKFASMLSLPAEIVNIPGWIKIDEIYATTLAARGYPGSVEDGWLGNIFNIEGNISVVQYIETLPAYTAGTRLDKRRKGMRSDISILEKEGKTVPKDLEVEYQETEAALERLSRGDEKLVRTGLYVSTMARSPQELSTLQNRLLRNSGLLRLRPVAFRMDQGVSACLPFARDSLNITHEFLTSSFAPSFIFNSPATEITGDCILLGSVLGSGEIFAVSLLSFQNKNGLIVGTSGAGKTVTMGIIIDRCCLLGVKMIIVDLLGDYVKLVDDLGGAIVGIRKESDVSRELKKVFNANHCTCINLANIAEDEERKRVVNSVLKDVYYFMNSKPVDEDLFVVLDEAWKFLEYSDATEGMNFLAEIIRTGRHKSTGVLTSTQSPDDFIASKAGKAVLDNSFWTIILKVQEKVIDNLLKRFNLNERQREIIVSAGQGEALFHTDIESTPIKIMATERELALLKSEEGQ